MIYLSLVIFFSIIGLIGIVAMKPKKKVLHSVRSSYSSRSDFSQLLNGGRYDPNPKGVIAIFGSLFAMIAGFGFVMSLVLYGTLFYVLGSAITSGVKAFNKDCNKEYQIESFVNGDFFCEKD